MTFFFETSDQLAAMFTKPQPHDPETQGKYLEGGLKPVEAFCKDILQNLVSWSTDSKKSIYYKTKDYWYLFQQNEAGTIVTMTRFENNRLAGGNRLDTWANTYSITAMREFRLENKDKKVDLISIS